MYSVFLLGMAKKFIHLDCDCFYAAVEMRDNPALVNIPIAIGGKSDRRGVIATCNYPARAFGVRSAMSSVKALQLCPQLHLMPGNMEKYRAASEQIFAIYKEYTPLVETLSLDEAYLDVSQASQCQGSATLIAEEIRARVKSEVGITVSAGVAPAKFLAKVASDWNKPDGLFVLRPKDVELFLETLPVSKLSGVGKKTAQRMHRLGLDTCGQLKQRSLEELTGLFGKFGQRLYDRSRGIDTRGVSTDRVRKSVSVEKTFDTDLPNLSACATQLPSLLERLAIRLQRLEGKASASGIFVKVKFADFSQTTAEQAGAEANLSLFIALLNEAWL
ncbi:MAG: DNA polymerase IV, partial [Pontibacterium sp.]